MELNAMQQYLDEHIDSYFLRKLRAIRLNIPDETEEQKVHFLSLGLKKNF